MPTQLPREATDFFGDLLLPHVQDILKSNAEQAFEGHEEEKMGPVVANSVITSNGSLTERFKYISDLRKANAPIIKVRQWPSSNEHYDKVQSKSDP